MSPGQNIVPVVLGYLYKYFNKKIFLKCLTCNSKKEINIFLTGAGPYKDVAPPNSFISIQVYINSQYSLLNFCCEYHLWTGIV